MTTSQVKESSHKPAAAAGAGTRTGSGTGASLPQKSFTHLSRGLAAAVLALGLVLGTAFGLPPIDDPQAFGLLKEKHRILSAAKSPKIIFVGGSNLFFGLDSPRVRQELGYDCANMGFCAALALPFMFEELKHDLKPGDIVVLSPEFALFGRLDNCTALQMQVLDCYPQAIQWVLPTITTPERAFAFVHEIGQMSAKKIQFLFKNIRHVVRGDFRWRGEVSRTAGILSKSNIDQYGDLTWHLTHPRVIEAPTVVPVPPRLENEAIQSLNQFDAYCRSRGARLVISPCPWPLEMTSSQPTVDSIKRLYSQLKASTPVPVLGDPMQFTYPLADFYSTYHLAGPARQQRTTLVIDELKKFVASTKN